MRDKRKETKTKRTNDDDRDEKQNHEWQVISREISCARRHLPSLLLIVL